MKSAIGKIFRYGFLGIGALILLWVALKLLVPEKEVALPPIARLDAREKAEFLASLQHSGLPPEEYIVSRFKTHDVILLGEFHRIRHDPLFVQHLLPALYRNGVHLLGFEYACPEDQSRVDSLLTGRTYDESLAIGILRNLGGGMWPYQEYLDVFKSAWQLNSGLPDGAERFRILPMTAFVDGEKLNHGSPRERLEQRARLVSTDSIISEIVEREAIGKGKKILVYCGTHHAFTRFRQPRYDEDALKCLGGYAENRGGQRILRKHPQRALTVILHAPHLFPSYGTFGLPWNGIVDQVFEDYQKPVGFDVGPSPFGGIIDSTSVYACGEGRVSFSDFCDGYIVLDRMRNYRAVSLVPDWLNGTSFSDFKRHFIKELPFFIFHPWIFFRVLEAEGNPAKEFPKLQRQLDRPAAGRDTLRIG
jgi:hypothetical protein